MRSRRLVEILVTATGGRGVGYRELATVIHELVLHGQLLVGDTLPSERTLSTALGCSRTTVTAALGVLRAEGIVVSRQGSGTVVAATVDDAMVIDARQLAHPDRRDQQDVVDLFTAAPPAPPTLPDLAHTAADRLAGVVHEHGMHEFGLPELRAAIARHLSARGVPTSVDQILVTQGVVHGWNLVLSALVAPGMSVGVEQPTMPHLHDAAAAASARVVTVGVDRDGWHLPRELPDLLLVTADHHNPSGVDQGDDARRALLRALPSSTRLVVDTVLSGLDLAEQPARRPLAAVRPDTIVLGSLSKTVWAGLRVGWIRASPATIGRLTLHRLAHDICGPALDQLLAVEVFRELDRLTAQTVQRARSRMGHLRSELARAGWETTAPDGGHCLWIDLGADGSSTELARAARGQRLWITPGAAFSLFGTHDRWLRLPFCAAEPVLTEGVRRLARAADTIGAAAGRSSGSPPRLLQQPAEVA